MTDEERVQRVFTEAWTPERAAQLAAIGPGAVEPLIRVLVQAQPDDWTRILDAAQALGEIGDLRAVEPLITVATRGDWVRPRVLCVLARFDHQGARATVANAVETYLGDLSHSNRDRRQKAAWALGMLRHRSALRSLMTAASDPDRGVSLACAVAVASIGGTEAEAFLLARVRSRDATDRRDGIEGLKRLGPSPARLSTLTTLLLGDRHPAVRQTAAWALREVGDETVVQALQDA